MQEETLRQIISAVYALFRGQPPEQALQQLVGLMVQALQSPVVLNDQARADLQSAVEHTLREAGLIREVNI